jgi:hypothetical protein
MRVSCAFVVYVSAAAALAGCVQLPALDFQLRSTWRAHPQHDGRSLEVIAGVLLGWAGGNRTLAPIDAASDALDAEAQAALGFAPDASPPSADDAMPCADVEVCRWESDARSAALERAARSEQELP